MEDKNYLIKRWSQPEWQKKRQSIIKNIQESNSVERFLRARASGKEEYEFADLRGIDLAGEVINLGRLYRANLQYAKFDRCEVVNSSFQSATLDDASFIEAQLHYCSFDMTSMEHAIFSRAVIVGGSFCESNVTGAKFSGATISGVNFTGAKTNGADFNGVVAEEVIGLSQERLNQSGPGAPV